jgi:VanZ family protein
LNLLSLWAPVILHMAIIFGVSSLSKPGRPGGLSDNSGHFIGYALLSLLLVRALAGGRVHGITWRVVLLAVLGATLYGASDELHQAFVPGRTPDPADIVVDALGASAGAAMCLLWRVVATAWKHRPSRVN